MLVQNVSLSNQNYGNSCNFKSVYPVYHWLKFDGKYKPATKNEWVHRCQRLLAAMLNKASHLDLDHPGKSVLHNTGCYVASVDENYKSIPHVCSYYNNFGGFKNSPDRRAIDPMAYLVTGADAIEFEQIFGKPVCASKKQEFRSQKEIDESISRARFSYALKGPEFIKSRSAKFIDKESGNPVELHTIFERTSDNNHPLRMIKCSFFIQGDKKNPLITNGIIDP